MDANAIDYRKIKIIINSGLGNAVWATYMGWYNEALKDNYIVQTRDGTVISRNFIEKGDKVQLKIETGTSDEWYVCIDKNALTSEYLDEERLRIISRAVISSDALPQDFLFKFEVGPYVEPSSVTI